MFGFSKSAFVAAAARPAHQLRAVVLKKLNFVEFLKYFPHGWKDLFRVFKIFTPRSKADFCLHWSQVFGGPYLCRKRLMILSTEEGIITNIYVDLQTNIKLKHHKYEWVDLVVAAAPLTFTTHKGGWQLAELAAARFICWTFIWLFIKYLFVYLLNIDLLFVKYWFGYLLNIYLVVC